MPCIRFLEGKTKTKKGPPKQNADESVNGEPIARS